MAKTRQIKKRADAVRSIRDVTRTMEMVASARFQQTHNLAVKARPYTDRMAELLGDMLQRRGDEELTHPLLHEPEGLMHDVMLVVTSNRGLCGGHNQGVLKLATDRIKRVREAGYVVDIHVIGRKGKDYFRFKNMDVELEFPEFDDVPDFRDVCNLADQYMQDFLDGRISGLEVSYMQFRSAGDMTPAVAQLLPLSIVHPSGVSESAEQNQTPYELQPSAEVILEKLLPMTVRLRLYQCLVDSAVSEQAARITAMRGATDSANEMIDDLRGKYNRMRQAQITTELAEIMGGRAGLE